MAAFAVTQSWADDNSENSDVWEDDLLVEAYERASKRVDEVLKSRMDTKQVKHLEKKVRDNSDAMKNSKSDFPHKENLKDIVTAKVWKNGDFCRCTYSEDSVEYEAQIVDILEEKGLCRVKYLGYGNEEQQSIADLLPSKGNNTRKMQENIANARNVVTTEKKTNATFIPPPLNLPSLPVEQDDALASMLMSWYMAGYHTGYYQAMKTRET